MNTTHPPFDEAQQHAIRRIRSHPFVARCRAGLVSLDELKVFLVQHGHYGAHFTRYLCALMSNLPSNHDVFRLAANLYEEMGLDGHGGVTHQQLYQDMLADFGLTLESAPAFPSTQALITSMYTACRQSNPAHGLGALCLGAEALVPALYADVIQGFMACGVTLDRLTFFQIHVACDDGHADTLCEIMQAMAQASPSDESAMLSSANALLQARLSFLSGLAHAGDSGPASPPRGARATPSHVGRPKAPV